MDGWKIVALLGLICFMVTGIAIFAAFRAKPSARFLSPGWRPPEKKGGA